MPGYVTIEAIDFSQVTFTDSSAIPLTATVSGTLIVAYPDPPSVLSGTLTLSVGGNSTLFSTFTVSYNGSSTSFEVTSTSGASTVQFTYDGYGPTTLTSGTFVLSGDTFNLTNNTVSSFLECFAEGTLIRTPDGDVAIETLNVGDLVLTSSGEPRPVKWIGHRYIDCRLHNDPRAVRPVRIAVDAFGPNRPSRDLFVSPGHAICVDLCGEVLIPAGDLVNGASIACVEVDEVRYWHVELDSHDVLIANNLPAESFMDMGFRGFFAEAGATLDAPEGRKKTYADFCRPVAKDGPVLAFVRDRLMKRAEAIGWTQSRESDLHLLIDGCVRRPLAEGGATAFLFPASARDVRLKSKTFVPALVGGDDPRTLGVSLLGLVFVGGRGEARSVRLDDERLDEGCYALESNGATRWRWTSDELVLNQDFWEGLVGEVALLMTCDNSATRRWIAPDAGASAPREARPNLCSVAGA